MQCKCGTEIPPSRSNNPNIIRLYCSKKCGDRQKSANLRARNALAAKPCEVPGCEHVAKQRRLCDMHYRRLRLYGDVGHVGASRASKEHPRSCSVEGCGRVHNCQGLCAMHYNRQRLSGDVGPVFPKYRTIGEGYIDQRTGYAYTGGSRRRLQHRVVMEQMLGRPLQPFENVHHINGIRSDNRPENLELWCKPQPAGQRAIDLAEWVVENYRDLVRRAAA